MELYYIKKLTLHLFLVLSLISQIGVHGQNKKDEQFKAKNLNSIFTDASLKLFDGKENEKEMYINKPINFDNLFVTAFLSPPVVQKTEGGLTIRFELKKKGDVEVSIIDTQGKVIRHLAAGVLGGKVAPPMPLQPSLAQVLIWDGKDDNGQPVSEVATMRARVRTGMGVQLNRILGGDPYAFFSSEIQHYNHNLWSIAGIETKPDGTVYVFGTAGQQGPYTVRQFDADGNYLRTVFPFPAGMPLDKVSGWGVNQLADGTPVPAHTTEMSRWPSYSKTVIHYMQSGFGPQPILLPTATANTLTIAGSQKLDLLTFNTDSSINPDPKVHTALHLVQEPPLIEWDAWDSPGLVAGGIYTCPTIDGKGFYLSGICRADKPFWRPGQVWKVDYATRNAKPWFALPAEDVATKDNKRQISYTPLQGIATDGAGHIFVCDRANNRVVVLTEDAKPIRDLAVANPDDVAWDTEGKALYVTTRFGRQGAPGDVQLLRFDDWQNIAKPGLQMQLCINDMVIMPRERTHICFVGSGAKRRLWIGYKDLPIRIYRNKDKTLELVRDFYQSGQKLRFLAFRSMVADPVTDTLFFASGTADIWKLRDWEKADFRQCRDAAEQLNSDQRGGGPTHPRQIVAADVAIDSRNRFLYTRQNSTSRIYRWALDGDDHARAPVGTTGSPAVSTPLVMNEVAESLYFDRGMWPSPDGGMFVLAGMPRIEYNDIRLHYQTIDLTTGPSASEPLLTVGPLCGGLRIDRQGRIYIGIRLPDNTPEAPPGFSEDWLYSKGMGRIAVFEPPRTTTNYHYPTALKNPTKVYDIHYGHISCDSKGGGFSARFGVDDFGRICYPNTLTRSVALMDNAGNEILRFGTYGNIDDWRKLEGRWAEAKAIPLSWPGAVDTTDRFIYVADHANVGVMRLAKTWVYDQIISAQ